MSYKLPTFNLLCNIWRHGNATTNPPDITSMCNLALGRRVGLPSEDVNVATNDTGNMWLLLPAGTDIRDANLAGAADTVEVGAGSGRFYKVVWVDDIGGGFPNEHRFAVLNKQTGWATPFPRPGSMIVPPIWTSQFSDQWAAGTSGPRTYNIVNAVGMTIVHVITEGGASNTPNVVSTIGGTATLVDAVSLTDAFGTKLELYCFAYFSPGGTDVVTITWPLPSSGLVMATTCQGSAVDVHSTATNTGLAITLATASTTSPNEIAIAAAFNVAYSGTAPSAPVPWAQLFGGWIATTDVNGVSYALATWAMVQVAVGAPSITVTGFNPVKYAAQMSAILP